MPVMEKAYRESSAELWNPRPAEARLHPSRPLRAPDNSPGNHPDSGASESAFAFGDRLRVRYLTFNDITKAVRGDWLDTFAGDYELHVYSDSGTHYLSLAGSNFDVFIVGGGDVARRTKVLRAGEVILRGRVKIALVWDSDPQRRARLLSAGFDDVFDAGRMHAEEALARLRAIWRRYDARRRHESAELYENEMLEGICDLRAINKRERLILTTLLKAENGFVSYFTMQNVLSDYYEMISLGSLRVSMTHLRKKMRAGARIVSRSNMGYPLIVKRPE